MLAPLSLVIQLLRKQLRQLTLFNQARTNGIVYMDGQTYKDKHTHTHTRARIHTP